MLSNFTYKREKLWKMLQLVTSLQKKKNLFDENFQVFRQNLRNTLQAAIEELFRRTQSDAKSSECIISEFNDIAAVAKNFNNDDNLYESESEHHKAHPIFKPR